MRRRVLLLEDEPATQTIIKRMLEQLDDNLRIVCVSTAEDALATLNSDAAEGYVFSLVIADIGLPRSSGVDFWRHCKKLYPHLQVAFISGMEAKDIRKMFASEGPAFRFTFVPKPVDIEDLKRLVIS